MPLFTALLAMLMRHETHDLHRLSLVLLGFAGVCVVLSPTFGSINLALLAALASAMIEAFSFIMVVKHRSHEHPLAFAFYGKALMVAVAGFWPGWSMTDFNLPALLVSAGGGFCYAVATAFVLSAFHSGSPTTVSSMQYSQLIWGMLLGALIWAGMADHDISHWRHPDRDQRPISAASGSTAKNRSSGRSRPRGKTSPLSRD